MNRPNDPALRGRLLACALALLPACAGKAPAPSSAAAAPAEAPALRVEGQPIRPSDIAAHARATGLAPEAAAEDLVDLALLRARARDKGVALPAGPLPPEDRARAEYALAQALSLPVPAAAVTLVVDHAWVKDAAAPRVRAAQRKAIDRLRGLVESGAKLGEAYPKLAVNGADWHIGDHEEYGYDVVPAEAHDLPPGALSPVIPGNGGLHLFKIFERKSAPPAPEQVSEVLRPRLREGARIERLPPSK